MPSFLCTTRNPRRKCYPCSLSFGERRNHGDRIQSWVSFLKIQVLDLILEVFWVVFICVSIFYHRISISVGPMCLEICLDFSN